MSNNTIYGISLHEEEMQRSEMLDLLPPQTGGQPLGRECSFSFLSWQEMVLFSGLEEKGECVVMNARSLKSYKKANSDFF